MFNANLFSIKTFFKKKIRDKKGFYKATLKQGSHIESINYCFVPCLHLEFYVVAVFSCSLSLQNEAFLLILF